MRFPTRCLYIPYKRYVPLLLAFFTQFCPLQIRPWCYKSHDFIQPSNIPFCASTSFSLQSPAPGRLGRARALAVDAEECRYLFRIGILSPCLPTFLKASEWKFLLGKFFDCSFLDPCGLQTHTQSTCVHVQAFCGNARDSLPDVPFQPPGASLFSFGLSESRKPRCFWNSEPFESSSSWRVSLVSGH